jgi:hypothetical protein
LGLKIPNPEGVNKALEIFFEATSTLQEWISYETNYARQGPMQDHVAMLEAQLPDLFLGALLLICDIHYSVTKVGFSKRLEFKSELS